jgi:serine/threonine protein phosphatase PrpC
MPVARKIIGPAPAETATRVRIEASSDPGRVRSQNEDAFAFDERTGIAMIADGIGGGAAGEVASRIACEEALRSIHDVTTPSLEALARLTARANRAISENARSHFLRRGMGTTFDVLWIARRTAWIAHVGDSRIYRIRSHEAQQITHDHNLAEELREAGVPDIKARYYENILTRSLGQAEDAVADLIHLEAEPGDAFLLCTDGVTRYFKDAQELAWAVEEFGLDAAPYLVSESIRRGGADNATAVVVDVLAERPAASRPARAR